MEIEKKKSIPQNIITLSKKSDLSMEFKKQGTLILLIFDYFGTKKNRLWAKN
jgi:hypothetical protein